jgi:excinuclease ABC subunit C
VKPYDGKKTLDTDLHLTPGIEVGQSTAKDYKRNLRKLIRYLEGDREKLLKDLEKTMYDEASKGNYELAAEARNQLFGLKELKKKIVFSDKEFLDISSDQALKQLQTLLKLPKPPRRIEGYDISHQSGENTVGSMVVFINGTAARSEYRKFKIRTSTNNDLKSLTEMISRRLKHKEWDFPDLILLDGGITQVNAILPLVEPYGIPVIGRDKSGDHTRNASTKLVVPNTSILGARPQPLSPQGLRRYSSPCQAPDPIGLKYLELPTSSHVSRLIARIDEEAHRFAITYHSLLKRKSMLK